VFDWLKAIKALKSNSVYAVVCVQVPDGVSPELGLRLRDVFNRLDPDGWWFINPGSFLAIFAVNAAGRDRAKAMVAAIENLKSTDPELLDVHIGRAEGPLSNVSARPDGKVLDLPTGKALNDAAQDRH